MTSLPYGLPSEGHWCATCESFRVRSVGAKCPSCTAEEAEAYERATRKPQ